MKGLKVTGSADFSRWKLQAGKAYPAFLRHNQHGEQVSDANRCLFGWGIA